MNEKQVKKKKVASNPLTDPDDVLNIADYLGEAGGKFSKRNKVLFLLGCATGYRTGDLVELKVRDIKEAIAQGKFIIHENKVTRQGKYLEKKTTPRETLIIDELKCLLLDYIQDKKSYEYMFPSNKKKNKHISVECISKIIKQAASYFGLKNITAHSMRKTYGWNQYLVSGKDITYVKDLFGHESREYTELYLNTKVVKEQEYSKNLSKFFRKY